MWILTRAQNETLKINWEVDALSSHLNLFCNTNMDVKTPGEKLCPGLTNVAYHRGGWQLSLYCCSGASKCLRDFWMILVLIVTNI